MARSVAETTHGFAVANSKLNENQPQIVHFSSHGSPEQIILESGDEVEESGAYGPSLRSADDRDMKRFRPADVEVGSKDFGHGQPQAVSKSALVNVLRSCNEGNLRLVEELLEHRVRLHPLVREFAEALTPKDETPEFRHSCARRIAKAFEDLTAPEEIMRAEGPDGLHYALATAVDFAAESHDGVRPYLRSMLRVFQRECQRLREWNHGLEPNRFAQQFHFRALTLGEIRLAEIAENRLIHLAQPALILRWRTFVESPALVRVLSRHRRPMNSVAVGPDSRLIASGSEDQTVVIWNLDSGKRLATLALDSSIRSGAWFPDGRFVLVGDTGGNLYRLEYRER